MQDIPTFKKGMDLLTDDGGDTEGTLRDAKNVLLDRAGTVWSRPTPIILDAGSYLDIYADGDLLHAVDSANWYTLDGANPRQVLLPLPRITRAKFIPAPASVLLCTDGGYWRYDGSGVVRLDVQKPPAPNLTPIPGSLPRGEYKVAIAARTPDGLLGPISWPNRVTASGIQVTLPTGLFDVFASRDNGLVMFQVGQGVSGTFNFLVQNYGMEALGTAEDVMPVGAYYTIYQGRLFVVAGSALFFSLPYRYGVIDAYAGFFPLPARGVGLVGLDGPLYIGTDSGAWVLNSADMNDAKLQKVHSSSVVPGSMLLMDGEGLRGVIETPPEQPVAIWFTPDGHVAGLPDGTTLPISPNRIQIGPSAGTSVSFPAFGDSFVVTFLAAPAPYTAKCVIDKP